MVNVIVLLVRIEERFSILHLDNDVKTVLHVLMYNMFLVSRSKIDQTSFIMKPLLIVDSIEVVTVSWRQKKIVMFINLKHV